MAGTQAKQNMLQGGQHWVPGILHLTPTYTDFHACARHPRQQAGRVEACLDKCDGVGGQQLPKGGGHLLSLSSPVQQLIQQRLEDKTLVAVYEGYLQRQGMQRATAQAHRGQTEAAAEQAGCCQVKEEAGCSRPYRVLQGKQRAAGGRHAAVD